MALTSPYKQHHYIGEFANDAAALTDIQNNKWDSTKNGTGTPEQGMLYFNTTTKELRYWDNTVWAVLAIGAAGVFIRADGTVPFTAAQSMGGFKLTNVGLPTAATDAASKEYVDQHRDWQESVLDKDLTAPPGAPSNADRYLIAAGATGAWSGHDNEIAEWNTATSAWLFYAPTEGTTTRVEDENKFYVYDGAAWGTWEAASDHNILSNLQGGTTAQYYHLTATEHTDLTTGVDATAQHIHDSRYYTETEIGSTTPTSEGANLVGTDTKTHLNNATTVEVALTELDTRDPPTRSSGTGNPNGVVSGVVGDIYVDTTNYVKYMNTTGTNTGWDVM